MASKRFHKYFCYCYKAHHIGNQPLHFEPYNQRLCKEQDTSSFHPRLKNYRYPSFYSHLAVQIRQKAEFPELGCKVLKHWLLK